MIPNETIVDMLSGRADAHPDRPAIMFLADGEEETTRWTYGDVEQRSRALAVRLSDSGKRGDRVLLLTPASAEFAAAFFGCLYAGMIAIPAYPPRNRRHMPRIDAILRDAGAAHIVTVSAIEGRVREWLGPEWASRCRVICADRLENTDATAWRPSGITAGTTALLQYTSGSTGEPKGVEITHENLLANQRMIQQRFQHDESSSVVSWLPLFHDMGLVGNLMQPLYLGAFVALMPPVAFLQRPARWFEMITRYRPHTTGAPNFAYALSLRAIKPEHRDAFDLTSLRNLYVGSEPIDPDTLRRFTAAFQICGLRPEAMLPCYGLAETTLLATSGSPRTQPIYLSVAATGSEGRPADGGSTTVHEHTLVGCGGLGGDQVLLIVDPETRRRRTDGGVGEIWIQGPHVARGYWNRPELTAATFAAHLDTGEGPFLRTGDLGLVRGTELFVTGRLKDVLVIHGANHYPSDIERTAAACHPDLQPDAGAAFGVSVDGEEKLVVVNEVHRSAMRRLDGATIGRAIRRAVFEEHDIPVHAVVLVAPTSVPKTSSGKIQRQACKAAFLQHTLRECWSDIASAPVADERSASRADEIVAWLRWYGEHRINSRLMDERRSIPPHIVLDFARHGLLGLQAPVEHGGIALSFHDTFRVLEQLAAIDLSLCSFVGVHNVLAVRPVAQFGSDEQRRTVLRELAEGRQLGSFAFTEPAAGSNPLAITATATPTATGWTLQGSKKWIGTAAWAGYVHVFAHLRNAAGGHDGITAFIVPQDTAGFRQGPEELTLGMRAMVQNSIYMDDVHVGPEHVLGTVGQGLPIAYDIMQFARVQVAAGALGGMKRCFQLMSRYASRRTIATGRLLDNVISRDHLSDLAIEISAVEAFVYAFASWLDRGLHVPEELFAAVKVAAPEALGRAADHLVQMLGGRGYIETNIAPQIVRDARLLRIFEGPSETMLMFIGARLFSGSGLVLEFLSDRLGQPDLASQLADAVQAVRDHFSRAASNDARQQAAFVLGELGIAAVWRAAIEDHAQRTTDPNHARALAWATTRFERSRQRAAEARPDDRALLGGDEILAIARRHIEGIGDVVQRAAGELHQLDALLQRDEDAAGSHASRATRDVTVHVSSRPPELTATSVSVAGATADLERWIQRWIAERLHVDAAAISPRKPFYDFGVDSVTALELTSGLGEKLTRDLPATLLWDYPNIHELAVYLASASAREVARDPVRTLPVEEDESGLTELEIEQRLELELRFLGRSQFH